MSLMSNHVIHVTINAIHVTINVIHVDIHAITHVNSSSKVSKEAFSIRMVGRGGWVGQKVLLKNWEENFGVHIACGSVVFLQISRRYMNKKLVTGIGFGSIGLQITEPH
jgi:hypothetical protein